MLRTRDLWYIHRQYKATYIYILLTAVTVRSAITWKWPSPLLIALLNTTKELFIYEGYRVTAGNVNLKMHRTIFLLPNHVFIQPSSGGLVLFGCEIKNIVCCANLLLLSYRKSIMDFQCIPGPSPSRCWYLNFKSTFYKYSRIAQNGPGEARYNRLFLDCQKKTRGFKLYVHRKFCMKPLTRTDRCHNPFEANFREMRSEPHVSLGLSVHTAPISFILKRGNNYTTDYMPPRFSIWNTTNIFTVMNGNFNMVQGNLRHIDRSTTITNTDPFNVELESTVAGQSSPSTTSPGKSFIWF